MVLLHGLGVSSDSWRLQVGPLSSAGYRVIAPDMRGFGRSAYPGRMNIQVMAGDVIALIAALLNGRRVDLVGISMGGTIALQIALQAGRLVNRLVLANTFAHLRPQGLGLKAYYAYRMLLVHTLGVRLQGRLVARRLFPNPDQEDLRAAYREQISMANPAAYRAAIRSLARFDAREQLSRIQSPTLVVTGEADTTVPPAVQDQLRAGIRRARQVYLPRAGHAMSVAQPEAFNAVVLAFLTETSHPDGPP